MHITKIKLTAVASVVAVVAPLTLAGVASGTTHKMGPAPQVRARLTPAIKAKSGTIHILDYEHYVGRAHEGVTNFVGTDVVTGAFADHGTATTPTASSAIVTYHLTKGTIVTDESNYESSATHKDPGGDATCSYSGTYAAGRIKILSGTGAYAGATGTLIETGAFSFDEVKRANGTCNHTVATALTDVNFVNGRISF